MNLRIGESIDSRIEKKMDSAEDNKICLDDSKTKRDFISDIFSLIIGVCLIFFVWWIIGSTYNTFFSHSLKFPMPDEVINELFVLFGGEEIFTHTVWEHITASLYRWIIGFSIAALIGIVLGLLVSSSTILYKILMIPVNILQMIPGLAWLPVVMILFGFGDVSAIFIVGVVAIAPIAINVSNGLRNVPKVNRRVADMSGISAIDRFLEVTLPFAALDIVSGLRIGLGSSWRMIIAAEMVVGVMTGIGFTIKDATDSLDYTTAFAGIIIICIIGLLVDRIVFNNIERHVRKLTGTGEL